MTGRAGRLVVPRFGGPEVLRWDPLGRPTPGPGQVLIRMLAAGLARADLLARAGRYPGGPRPPYVPGWELVGVVDEVGPDAGELTPGQRVAGLPLTGAQADWIVLPAAESVPIPRRLDPVRAAAVPLNYLTAQRLLRRSGVGAGATILVHGAAGGVGTALLDLARAGGIRALGSASSGKYAIVDRYAATPLDRRSNDLAAAVDRLSPGGVDAAFVAHGGAEPARVRAATRRGGVMISFGFETAAGDPVPILVRAAVQQARLRAWATLPGPRVLTHRTSRTVRDDPPGADLRRLFDLLAAGAIDPLIDTALPLTDASAAHRRLESGTASGKIILLGSGLPS